MVRHEQLVGNRQDILREGRPGLLEPGFGRLAAFVTLLVARMLRPKVVLPAADAGDRDGIDAVVRVVHALLLSVVRLQAPHAPELRRRRPLDRIDPVEDRLQIEPRILPDDADVDPLAIAEPLGHLGHGEAFELAAPIVELHLQIMPPLDGPVLLGLGRRSLALAPGRLDPLAEVFDLLRPAERFDPGHHLAVCRQLRGQLGTFGLAIETVLA